MQQTVSRLPRAARRGPKRGAALVLALAAHLSVQPVLPAFAGESPARETASRAAAPEAAAERSMANTFAAARFQRVGTRHTLRGGNGVKLTTSLGRWRAGRVEVRGASVKVTSPWGEELAVDMFIDDAGVLARLNDRIEVMTTFDADRAPLELQVTVDGETTTTFLGNRAQRFAAGAPIGPHLDMRAHHALAVALAGELSPAFLAGLRDIDRPAAEVGCWLELFACGGAVAAWIIDVASMPAACVVGGLPTFGISCALAVVGHELASAAVALACGQYADCRSDTNTPIEEVDESTPILLDMDGRGFHLTGLDDPVVFDLTADGVPDRVSWTARGGDEAFLVLDRNGNGRIDDGSELFGSRTPLADGARAQHGFLALTEYDLRGFGGNENGRVDAGDAIFERLMLWTDRDRDGVSERRELASLRQAGVVSLSLDYRVDARRDRHGNKFVLNSKAIVEVRGHRQPRAMSDVYLRIDR